MAKREQGIALLSVLLAMSIGIILAATMTDNFRFWLRSSSSMQNMEQAWWYALSAEELAIKALLQDLKDDPDVTHLSQYWATSSNAFPMENGSVSGNITDAMACFNLNSLQQEDSEAGETSLNLKIFQSLLEQHELDSFTAEQISESTRNWVHSSLTQVSGRGAVDSDYLSLPVPYLAANTLMHEPSEWRAVQGVSAAIANRVLPDLCAIPSTGLSVNVNTITEDRPELMTALFMGELSSEQATELLQSRPRNGWTSVDDFLNNSVLLNVNTSLVREVITVHSNFFELHTRAEAGGATLYLRSLFWRKNDSNVDTIRRRLGEKV